MVDDLRLESLAFAVFSHVIKQKYALTQFDFIEEIGTNDLILSFSRIGQNILNVELIRQRWLVAEPLERLYELVQLWGLHKFLAVFMKV
jgi:hypothetical protein